MKNRIILVLGIIFVTLGQGWTLAGERSSSAYKITTEVLDSSGGYRTSTSYNLLGKAREFKFGIPESLTYKIREGFIPTAFPELAVLITSITPASGYNTGTINISEIAGAGFTTGAAVKLTKSGESDLTATNVTVVSASKITCDLDLTGKATGAWNIVVTNPDSQSGNLPNAFTINTWASSSQLVNYPNPFNPLNGSTTIVYKLDSDANTSVLIFNITHELMWKYDFVSGSNGGKAGDNSVIWNGYNAFAEMAGNGIYFCEVINRASGKVLAKGKIAVFR